MPQLARTAAVLMVAAAIAAAARGAETSANQQFEPTAQDQIVPSDARVELLWNGGEFTEGPAPAADGAILFSDIGNRIYRYDPGSGQTTVFRDPSGKSNGLMFDPRGRLVACEGAAPGGNRRISISDSAGNVRTLADRFEGRRFNSPNDLAIDAAGRVYFSDPRYVGTEPRELDFEAVFLVEPDGTVRVATRDVQKPNGILVAPDGRTVYVSDNNNEPRGNHQLVAFAVRPEGTLGDKRVLYDFGPNRRGIDGMTLDTQGNIYATAGSAGEAGVYVFSPRGEPLALIATPGDPTNCVFGVGGESSSLYITAAGPDPPKSPDGKRSYALYRIRLTTPGYHRFPPAKP